MSVPFALDKRRAKVMGVCAGLARSTKVDVTLIRVVTVVAVLLGAPFVILAYLLTGWLANDV